MVSCVSNIYIKMWMYWMSMEWI